MPLTVLFTSAGRYRSVKSAESTINPFSLWLPSLYICWPASNSASVNNITLGPFDLIKDLICAVLSSQQV